MAAAATARNRRDGEVGAEMPPEKETTRRQHMESGFLMKMIVGLGFGVQGLRCFPWMGVSYFLKDALGLPPSALQMLLSASNLPMLAKPLLGLLSDAVPLRSGGQRRLPYIAIGALFQAISWFAIALWPSSAISVPIITVFLLLSNLGASMAEVANDAIVTEAAKQQSNSSKGSGQLQSFAAMSAAITGVIGNLLSSHFTPKHMFLLFAVLLVIQLLITAAIHEDSLHLPKIANSSSKFSSIRKQLSDLFLALRRPDISRSIIWFFLSYAVIPLLLGTMFFYQTENMKMDSSVISVSKVFGQFALLVWSAAYEKYLKRIPVRKVLLILQFALAALTVSDTLFVRGFYQKLGLPDAVYVVIFSGLYETMLFFKVLPFSILIARLCPAGCEGSLMAFVMSALALGLIVSGYLGVGLAAMLGLSGNDFSMFPTALLTQAAFTVLPVFLSSWIADIKRPEKKDE